MASGCAQRKAVGELSVAPTPISADSQPRPEPACRRQTRRPLAQFPRIDSVLPRFHFDILDLRLELLLLFLQLFHLLFHRHHVIALVYVDPARRARILALETLELFDPAVRRCALSA